jgi:hypothetical protein
MGLLRFGLEPFAAALVEEVLREMICSPSRAAVLRCKNGGAYVDFVKRCASGAVKTLLCPLSHWR